MRVRGMTPDRRLSLCRRFSASIREKGQSLRISFIGGEIPRDRESVFWVNILEVKPQPQGKKTGTANYIQFPVSTG